MTVKSLKCEWQRLEFASIASLSKGKHNPIQNAEAFKCIELEHISQGSGTLLGYTYSNLQASTKNIFSKGDVLFGKLRPYLRKYLCPNFNGVCSSEIWVLQSKNEICLNRFLYFLVQSERFIRIANVTSGSKMPRADWSYISEQPFLLPPLPEQKKIAAILGKWDEGIETVKKLIAAKRKIKIGLMQQLLTGKKRFKEFKGQKWKEVKLRNIGSFSKGAGISKAEVLSSGIPAVRYGELYTSHHIKIKGVCSYINEESKNNSREIKSGDILFAGSGETADEIGKSAVYLDKAKAFAGGDIIIFSPVQNDSLYLAYALNCIETRKKLRKLGQGHSVVHIYKRDLETLRISLPPIKEQQEIAAVLNAADKEIELLSDKLKAIKQQKKGLMQKLLTGKIRVNV